MYLGLGFLIPACFADNQGFEGLQRDPGLLDRAAARVGPVVVSADDDGWAGRQQEAAGDEKDTIEQEATLLPKHRRAMMAPQLLCSSDNRGGMKGRDTKIRKQPTSSG